MTKLDQLKKHDNGLISQGTTFVESNFLMNPGVMMQAPLELVGLGSSSSMDSFASWKINGSGMEKEEREETPLQGEDESRRSSPP